MSVFKEDTPDELSRLVHIADKALDCWFEFEDYPEACQEWMETLDNVLRKYGKGSAKYDPQLWSI